MCKIKFERIENNKIKKGKVLAFFVKLKKQIFQ